MAWTAIAAFAAALIGLGACSTGGAGEVDPGANLGRLKLATTTSMYNIGLWDVLEPAFEDRYGVDLDVITGGTGQAIEAGKRGDVDVLTLHDRAREEEFVAQGYGLQRHPIAYNSFIIVGPPNDPAGIRGMEPEVAFLEIMEQGIANPGNVKFVSRGDRSGTHSREMLIWQLAGLDYESVRSSGRWYIEAGGGMGAILRLAHEKSAYTLAVSSAYIAFRDKLDLASLVDGEGPLTGAPGLGSETLASPVDTGPLLNVYSAIAVNPERHPDANVDMAQKLIGFLTSDDVQDLIGSYGLDDYGTPLLIPARRQGPQ